MSGGPYTLLWNHRWFGVQHEDDISLGRSGSHYGSSPVAANSNKTWPVAGLCGELCHLGKWDLKMKSKITFL